MPCVTHLQAGDKFHHQTLGLCQIREVFEDGTVRVCTADVIDGHNTFRLYEPSVGLHRYNYEVELGF